MDSAPSLWIPQYPINISRDIHTYVCAYACVYDDDDVKQNIYQISSDGFLQWESTALSVGICSAFAQTRSGTQCAPCPHRPDEPSQVGASVSKFFNWACGVESHTLSSENDGRSSLIGFQQSIIIAYTGRGQSCTHAHEYMQINHTYTHTFTKIDTHSFTHAHTYTYTQKLIHNQIYTQH